MPTARQVMSDFGAVFQVAGLVEVRICITAALNPEELQGVFEDGIVDGRVHMECCRSVFAYDKEVFACCRKRSKIGSVQVFFFCADGVLFTKLINAFHRVESSVNPDVWLCGTFLDKSKVSSTWNFFTAVRIDDLEGHFLWIGDIGVLVVLRSESALVHSDGTSIVDVQRVQIASATVGTRSVYVR